MVREQKYLPDPHSHFDPNGPIAKVLHWEVTEIDFQNHVLHAVAYWKFDKPGWVSLDSRGLKIKRVGTRAPGGGIPFGDYEGDELRGGKLMFEVPASLQVVIEYSTDSDPDVCTGLQWFEAADTDDKIAPMLFSQGEAINVRTYLPCQDTPQVKFTMTAVVTRPQDHNVMVRLSAIERIYAVDLKDGLHQFYLDHPIPSYLLTIFVGHFAAVKIDSVTTVYCEPSLVAQSRKVFGIVPQYTAAARALLGAYQWGEFNLLVAVWTFAFGGMENPTLTVMSKTTLHPSGANTIGHEFVHSWFGNGVTNALWCDFWLNEGFTVFIENKINQRVQGLAAARLQWALLERGYRRTVEKFADRKHQGKSELNCLRPDISQDNPDDVFGTVPYYLGAYFLRVLELDVGEHQFMAFLRLYLSEFMFGAVTTDDFLQLFEKRFPDVLANAKADKWFNGVGVPEGMPTFSSEIADEAMMCARKMIVPHQLQYEGQFVIYLEELSRERTPLSLAEEILYLADHPDPEVQCALFLFLIESGYLFKMQYSRPALFNQIEKFLATVGRMKFIGPMYRSLLRSPAGNKWVREVYARVGPTYHAGTRSILAKEFKKAPVYNTVDGSATFE